MFATKKRYAESSVVTMLGERIAAAKRSEVATAEAISRLATTALSVARPADERFADRRAR
jgi:hypothetical protein